DDGPAVGQAPAVDLDHLAADGLELALLQPGDGAHVGEVLVGAGEVKEEVADGADAEAVEQLGAGRADALEELDALPERVGVRRGRRVARHGRCSSGAGDDRGGTRRPRTLTVTETRADCKVRRPARVCLSAPEGR